MTAVRDQLFPQKPPGSRFRFSRTGVQPSPGSSTIELPSAFAESGAYPPDLIENYQALPDSTPCLSRTATLPKATKLELGRGAHLKTPSSANHTAAASQPTGRIAKAASWLHLSRVSPALLPPERPSHTHTPKPGFGGRGHEVWLDRKLLERQHLHTLSPTKAQKQKQYVQKIHTFSVEAVGQVYNQKNESVYVGGNVNHNANLSVEVDQRIRNAI